MSHIDSEEEREIIDKAKKLLMRKFRMSEMDAYVFIRKSAMDNKLRKSEISQAILDHNEVKS